MRIDQLALLLALVLAANLFLVVALELPRLARRSVREDMPGLDAVGAGLKGINRPVPAPPGDSAGVFGPYLYQRVVRVVSFVFIGAALVVVTLGGFAGQPGVYVVLAAGAFLIVFFQDVLPSGSLGRWRLAIEAGAAIMFLTVLLILTGGHASPFFFGYVLLVGAASLWSSGLGAPILAVITSLAYIAAVLLPTGPLAGPDLGRVAFNLIALALVTYVASVVGREQRRAREAALRLSRFDSLTGLYSRDYFMAQVEQEILRASRTGRPFGLLMVDLDGLKPANDRFGHAQGDLLLRAVADVLRGDIRVTDVAARYGGDEFVLILPETDMAGAMRVADKVRVDIARLALAHDGALIRTSASIGLVTFPDDGRSSAELMRRADLAMYEAKRRGRDQIVRFERGVGVPMGSRVAPAQSGSVPVRPSVPPVTAGRAPWETRGD